MLCLKKNLHTSQVKIQVSRHVLERNLINHSRPCTCQNAENTTGIKVLTGFNRYSYDLSDRVSQIWVSYFEKDYHTLMNSEVFKKWFINTLP